MQHDPAQPITEPADADRATQLREAFERLKKTADPPAEQLPADLLVAEPNPAAEIPAKVFVGPNATWYDDRWRWMDWRGRSHSWNWAAAATLGGWFAYRRMYWLTALCLAWLALLAALAFWGVPLRLLALAEAALVILMGVYGNALYLRHFRRVAHRVSTRHADHGAQLAAAAEAGGVSRRAAVLAAIALPAIVACVFHLSRLLGVEPDLDL